MQVFGLKLGQELENRPAHPPEEFPGVLPSPQLPGDFDLSCHHAWPQVGFQ